MQGLRVELADEWSEVPVLGGTRLVLGPGGQLLQVLTAEQALQLQLHGFKAAPEEARIKAALAAHGAVRKFTVGGGFC